MNEALRQAIEQVKQSLPIEEVVRQHVPGLRRQGNLWVACCPFHEERTPSFKVDPRKGFWHCYGACATGGDQISFVQRANNVDFMEALEILAARAGVPLPRGRGEGDDEHDGRRPLYEALERAARFYQQQLGLPVGQEARAYLRDRGLTGETVERFGLGFAPARASGPSDVLVSKALQGGMPLASLVGAGLARTSESGRPHDFFRNRLMFPVRDLKRRVVGFGARRLSDEDSAGPKYINTSETPLFHKGRLIYALDLALEHVRRGGHLVLVEGYTDVMAAHQVGLPQVGAVLGTATTDDHAHLVRKSGARRISLVFDGDEAGRKATYKALHGLLPLEVDIDVVRLPGGEDPCDLLVRAGAEPFLAALAQATGWFDFLLGHLLAQPQERRWREVDQVLELVTRLSKPLQREARLAQLAEALAVPLDAVRDQLAGLPGRRQLQAQRLSQQAQQVRETPAALPAIDATALRPWRVLVAAVLRELSLCPEAAPHVERCPDARLAHLLRQALEVHAREGSAASVASLLTALAGDPTRELVVPLLDEAMRSESARADFDHALLALQKAEVDAKVEAARARLRAQQAAADADEAADAADAAGETNAELLVLHAALRQKFTGGGQPDGSPQTQQLQR